MLSIGISACLGDNTNEPSGVSLAAEGFGFQFGTNRGLRPDPGLDVMFATELHNPEVKSLYGI